MENKKWKRFGSCLMALAMVLSGTALPASAATPGKDGSAEMNEAYAAHESLMPIGPSFSVATLLEWTPESDPDARYSRASIPMANREGGFVVNPKANPEAKLMLCSLANSFPRHHQFTRHRELHELVLQLLAVHRFFCVLVRF